MGKRINRVEVWFNNGLFRAFPEVSSFKFTDGRLEIIFGKHNNLAMINLNNVNFYELMYVE